MLFQWHRNAEQGVAVAQHMNDFIIDMCSVRIITCSLDLITTLAVQIIARKSPFLTCETICCDCE